MRSRSANAAGPARGKDSTSPAQRCPYDPVYVLVHALPSTRSEASGPHMTADFEFAEVMGREDAMVCFGDLAHQHVDGNHDK
jgi:hypothetical protein